MLWMILMATVSAFVTWLTTHGLTLGEATGGRVASRPHGALARRLRDSDPRQRRGTGDDRRAVGGRRGPPTSEGGRAQPADPSPPLPSHLLRLDVTLHPTKGMLFHGPPGTGKTMIARAIAAECNVPFVALTLASLENKYYGETSRLLRATFSLAKKLQPCILFFDEIDGLLRARTQSDQSCVYNLKTEMLNYMDGIAGAQNDAIFIIGCTNTVESLDPAVRRRLPRVYHVGLPNLDDRRAILQSMTEHLSGRPWIESQGTPRAPPDPIWRSLCRQARATRLSEQCNNAHFLESLEYATKPEEAWRTCSGRRMTYIGSVPPRPS